MFKKLCCFNIIEHGLEAGQGLASFLRCALSGKFKYLFKFEQGWKKNTTSCLCRSAKVLDLLFLKVPLSSSVTWVRAELSLQLVSFHHELGLHIRTNSKGLVSSVLFLQKIWCMRKQLTVQFKCRRATIKGRASNTSVKI